ncbi:MAG: hypothetical protein HYR72_26425 [Deltaproteobacteria bacterium]|nr:hypothetical protein [Deltaproteobacteria bacterium]MBI3391436.1 hypothetical protein [Deltaproteobacteria bacterium]
MRLTSVTLAVLILTGTAVDAATPLKAIRYTPDITVVLGGITVTPQNIAEDNLAGAVTLVTAGTYPNGTDIIAYDHLATGDQLLTFDTDLTLPGGLTVRPGDVVRFNGITYTLEFDATANGIPLGVMTDAVSEIGPNDLLLSFDVTVTLGSITADDEDLVRFHSGMFSLFFDGSAAGIDPSLDLDAAHILTSDGRLLLAFDGSGTVGAVNFTAEDMLEFTPTTTGWELSYDGLAEHSGWFGAQLHGLSAVTKPPPKPVVPGFDPNSGGGRAGSGVFPGSTRVFGMGTPNAVPGNSCILIYAVGPNGVPDSPPGSVDDPLLGTGGTNASGLFVDAMGNPGIAVSPRLRQGERIFAVDVCQGRVGQVVTVSTTPVPAASTLGLALMIGVLALMGLRARRVKS